MNAPKIAPGRPFWTAFTAFFANVIALLGLDKINGEATTRSWWTSLVASLFVAAAVYGREKLAARPTAADE